MRSSEKRSQTEIAGFFAFHQASSVTSFSLPCLALSRQPEMFPNYFSYNFICILLSQVASCFSGSFCWQVEPVKSQGCLQSPPDLYMSIVCICSKTQVSRCIVCKTARVARQVVVVQASAERIHLIHFEDFLIILLMSFQHCNLIN